jgi:ABC-type nitrate/sulfonate/bicarbonate transport system substrate-binding protein
MKRITRSAVLAAAMVISIVGAARSAELPVIRVGWTIPAEEAKYLMMRRPQDFPDIGKTYKIEWQQFQGTAPMLQGMNAGALDCATMAPMSLAQAAIETGLKAYIVGSLAAEKPGYFSVFWAVKADSPIHGAKDLKGKTLGTNAYGTGVYYYLKLWLKQNGIDPDRDVKIVETGFAPSENAIRSDRVDAGPMVQPFAMRAEAAGGLRPLFSFDQVQSPLVQTFEGCRKDFVDAHADVVRAYVRDFTRASRMVTASPGETRQVVADITHMDLAVLDKFLLTEKDFYRDPDGSPDFAAIQRNWDLFADAGFLSRRLNVSDFRRDDVTAPLN